MVLFIKGRNGINADVGIISKMMINIEKNKDLFRLNGDMNEEKTCNKPFNKYMYQQVEYNMTVSIGVVLIYVSDDHNTNVQRIINLLKHEFELLNLNNETEQYPIDKNGYKSTHYTIISKGTNGLFGTTASYYGTAYRKLISTHYDLKKCNESGTRFVWLIQLMSPSTDNSYLELVEFTKRYPTMQYLTKAVSTIIYDDVDLFKVKTGTKQINYPSIKQYNAYKENKILDITINISNVYGLDYEILSCYYNASFNYFTSSEPREITNYEQYQIRRVNTEKIWHKQIAEKFDYDMQEDLETKLDDNGKPPYPNDICFISNAPLYNYCYLLKVGKLNDDTKEYNNISHIMVNAFLLHVNYKLPKTKRQVKFDVYFHNYSKYTVIDKYIVKYPRSEIEAIEMIPANKIHPTKKEIMTCISKNGSYYINESYKSSKLYTINLQKNIVYIGTNSLFDQEVMQYKNTNSVIYTCHFNDST